MTPERWQQVKEAFHALVELPAEARAARLDELVDEDLRREVRSLLAASSDASSFLETGPPLDIADDRVQQSIGPWRVERLLGRGGMGAVYLAVRDDDELHREVALKIVKRGMDTDYIVRRFRDERRILAALSHPNIARLIDGGSTDDGVPWFAMELVRGNPIDRYCDEQQLGLDERLALFQTVCGAVHYAHQNLIVHRDIKPSNILITATGQPMLLDFGIAKLLDPESDSEATATEMRLLTPAYASPEQLAGRPLTTATDVYSLGVLLYELLTGRRPHDNNARTAEERAVPPPPSSVIARHGTRLRGIAPQRLVRKLRGDLDTIVAMALAPDPARRYASARDLAQDIASYRDGEPVVAHRERFAARAWRAVKRHRAAALAGVAVVGALGGGIIATTRQARIAQTERSRAETERARAERRFAEVRSLANRMLGDVHDRIAELPGSTPARRLVVEEGMRYLEQLSREAADDVPLLLEIAAGWLRLGDVQGNDRNANLGDRAGARASYQRALDTVERVVARMPQDRSARRLAAEARDRIGDAMWASDDHASARPQYEAAIALLQPLVAEAPTDRESLRYLTNAHIDLGETLAALGEDPRIHYRKALELAESLVAGDANDAKAARSFTIVLNKLGGLQEKAGDHAGALVHYRRALAMREAQAARAPDSHAARRDVSVSLERVGRTLKASGDLAGARDVYERALAIDEVAAAADPTNIQAAHDLANGYIRLSELDVTLAELTTDRAEIVKRLTSARAGFVRGRDIIGDLVRRGVAVKNQDAVPPELDAAIAKIDATLAR